MLVCKELERNDITSCYKTASHAFGKESTSREEFKFFTERGGKEEKNPSFPLNDFCNEVRRRPSRDL